MGALGIREWERRGAESWEGAWRVQNTLYFRSIGNRPSAGVTGPTRSRLSASNHAKNRIAAVGHDQGDSGGISRLW